MPKLLRHLRVHSIDLRDRVATCGGSGWLYITFHPDGTETVGRCPGCPACDKNYTVPERP